MTLLGHSDCFSLTHLVKKEREILSCGSIGSSLQGGGWGERCSEQDWSIIEGATASISVYALGPVGQDGVWLRRNSSGHSYEGGPSTLNDS